MTSLLALNKGINKLIDYFIHKLFNDNFPSLFRAIEERKIAKKDGIVLKETLLETAIKIGLRNIKSVKIPFFSNNENKENSNINNLEETENNRNNGITTINVDEKKSNNLNLFLRKSSSVVESLLYEKKRNNTEIDSEKNVKKNNNNNNGGNIFNNRVIYLGCDKERMSEEKSNDEVC